MESVGKLIKNVAWTIAGQPWLEIVFPSSCVSCRSELNVQRKDSHQDVSPVGLVSDSDFEEPDRTAQISIGGASRSLGFQDWQQLHWCDGCWRRINEPTVARCKTCGAGLASISPFKNRCAHCLRVELKFDRALAVGNYRGLLRELVIRMKNQHDDILAFHLGMRLGYELIGQGWTDFDRLIPVPLHWSRRLKRGFQATDLLSDRVSKLTGIRKCTQTVRVVRTTAKQGTLSTRARVANVRNAFAINPNSTIEGERILLIDDVMTSGATTSELARVLKMRGASEINVAVIVRGGVG